MPLLPIQLISFTYEQYPNYWLKAYEQGTTTPLPMATDSFGGTLLAKAQVSGGGAVPIGFIKTEGGAIFQPYIDGSYDLYLFPTAAEADANDTTNAIRVADNVDHGDSSVVSVSGRVVATVAELKALDSLVVGQSVSTQGYYAAGDGGGADYLVAPNQVVDGLGSHVLANNNVALIQPPNSGASVKQYGAVGDGATDDAASISAAIDSILSGGKIRFTTGTYVKNSGFSKTPAGAIEIICDPDVLIDETGNTDFNSFRFQTSKEASKSVTANLTEGETVIPLSDVSGISVGDVLALNSTDNFVPETTENLGSGEFIEVMEISGTDITVKSAIYDDYASLTTSVSKVNAHPITIRGLNIKRDVDNGSGIYIYYAHDVLIEDCNLEGCRERSIWIRNVLRANVLRCNTFADYTDTVGTNYGISIDGGQDVLVKGGSYRAGRHGIKIGATSEQLISRFITIDSVNVSADVGGPVSATWALDSHDPVDYVTVTGCTVTNGIGIQSRNCEIVSNEVYHASETGAFNTMIYVWPYTSNGRALIKDNILKQSGAASVIGIRFNLGVSTIPDLTYDAVMIENNKLTDVDTGIGVVAWQDDSGSKLKSLIVRDNTIINPATFAIECIPTSSPNMHTIDSVVVDGNPLLEGKCTFNNISDSTNITGNKLDGLNSFNRLEVAVSGNLEITGNSITKFTSSNGVFVNSKYVDSCYFADNIQVGNSGSSAVGLPRIANILGTSPFGKIAWSSVAPRHGLWGTGDRIYDSFFVSGGNIGWVVDTAGYGTRGAWTTATSYSLGEQVTNGGNLYRCVIAGTSGGTAPTHTSGEASDGGVTWEYITNSFTEASFVTFGAIA